MMQHLLVLSLTFLAAVSAQTNRGYYRFPAIHDNTIVFTAEGDLWTVGTEGGPARRLTTHPGDESHAAFSPDGKTVAFSANYEGPTEVYTIPVTGGLPVRRTFDGGARVEGWTPDGKVLFATRRFSGLPDDQLATVDAEGRVAAIPLSQAAEGSYDASGTLYFTRFGSQGSNAKRYQGGTAQNLWKFVSGQEAVPLTADWHGTSRNPMWWNGRLYFLSDRDGMMNLWSMNAAGKDLRQHTKHQDFVVQNAALANGRIVYQRAGDIRLYDIASATDRAVPIDLVSDFDQLREHWIQTPMEFLTAAHISPDGNRVALISRGRAFVAPVRQGRLVEIPSTRPGRDRDARFSSDGQSLILLSTESGEVELWKTAANGTGAAEQLTKDGTVLRWSTLPSPDGKWIAHQDKDNRLWLLETATRTNRQIAVSPGQGNSDPKFENLRWSPDSRWLLFGRGAANGFGQLLVYDTQSGTTSTLTTDRYESTPGDWSADGEWIFFLSDRSLKTTVPAPWGNRQPEPNFDRSYRIYALALRKGLRSPFEPADELHPDAPAPSKKEGDKGAPKVTIDLDGIAERLVAVPVPPGNYSQLVVAGNRLCWLDRAMADARRGALECTNIDNKGDKPETMLEDVSSMEVSGDGKKLLVRREKSLLVISSDAKAAGLRDPKTLADAEVDLKGWTFSVLPANEFREEYVDAWRLHRDYFYDRNMHGVDWKAAREKYSALVDRVRDRAELSDAIAQMVSDLSALHSAVWGGDLRHGNDHIDLASLGAQLARDAETGGYRVEHVYRSDPDRPDRRSPLARLGVEIGEGDVIVAVNGRDASAADIGDLLRNQAGKQVLLRVRPKDKKETRDTIVRPLSLVDDGDLRYHEWEYTRRLQVEETSGGKIGYVHLRAMGSDDIGDWMEQYSPIFGRDGLIVDVRHNRGGNIDSWILERLMRKAWMYWQARVGQPYWNMRQAFRGHVVVLCDEWTRSDGEAFAEGLRRLGLGKVIGTRTWGGQIWLTASNLLVDGGIAAAAESGVYGPERQWLIEGHGVDPDIVVDNLPHATFGGKDAQLEAAIQHLQELIREKPLETPRPPAYPDKSERATGSRK